MRAEEGLNERDCLSHWMEHTEQSLPGATRAKANLGGTGRHFMARGLSQLSKIIWQLYYLPWTFSNTADQARPQQSNGAQPAGQLRPQAHLSSDPP